MGWWGDESLDRKVYNTTYGEGLYGAMAMDWCRGMTASCALASGAGGEQDADLRDAKAWKRDHGGERESVKHGTTLDGKLGQRPSYQRPDDVRKKGSETGLRWLTMC